AVAAALALALVALAAGVVWSGLRETRARRATPEASAPAPRRDVASRPPATGTAPAPDAPDASTPTPDAPAPPDPRAFGPDDPARAWAGVDLEAVREALPGNLYWKLAAPTRDAAILRERKEIRARWNDEYGKVLSNTASESEVRAYYAWRRRLSADYVEFASHLLDHYGDVLPERDVGLLELAREMHLARLEEIPRKLSEALERREAHEAVRRQWREDQARFAETPADGEPRPAE
ncbi:MAG: hypothetical protein R3263_04100, partial [Myxococcota bacterium]|nr:hypothetical protein [Myxococcota bacterium]